MKYKLTETKIDAKRAIKNALSPSSLGIGVAIASQAELLAPVDLGQLRNSISASNLQTTKLLNDRGGEQAEALDTGGLKEGEVYAGSNCDHAIPQEFGTKYQVAQPFLRPAADVVARGDDAAKVVKQYGREAMEAEFVQRKVAGGK